MSWLLALCIWSSSCRRGRWCIARVRFSRPCFRHQHMPSASAHGRNTGGVDMQCVAYRHQPARYSQGPYRGPSPHSRSRPQPLWTWQAPRLTQVVRRCVPMPPHCAGTCTCTTSHCCCLQMCKHPAAAQEQPSHPICGQEQPSQPACGLLSMLLLSAASFRSTHADD